MVLIQLHGFHQPSSNMEKIFQVICGLHPAGKRISKVFYSLQEVLEDVQPIGGPVALFFYASFMQCKKLSTSSCRSLWKYHHYGLSNQSSVNLLEPKCAIGSLLPYLTCKIEWKHDPTAMGCPEGSSELWMKKTSPCTSWPEQESRNNGIKTHKKKQPHNQQKLAIHRK